VNWLRQLLEVDRKDSVLIQAPSSCRHKGVVAHTAAVVVVADRRKRNRHYMELFLHPTVFLDSNDGDVVVQGHSVVLRMESVGSDHEEMTAGESVG
jgi:hypothetical protein